MMTGKIEYLQPIIQKVEGTVKPQPNLGARTLVYVKSIVKVA